MSVYCQYTSAESNVSSFRLVSVSKERPHSVTATVTDNAKEISLMCLSLNK